MKLSTLLLLLAMAILVSNVEAWRGHAGGKKKKARKKKGKKKGGNNNQQPCFTDWQFNLGDTCEKFDVMATRITQRLKADKRVTCKNRNAADELYSALGWDKKRNDLKKRVNRVCDKFQDVYGLEDYRFIDFGDALSRMSTFSRTATGGPTTCLANTQLDLTKGCTWQKILGAMSAKLKTKPECRTNNAQDELMGYLGWSRSTHGIKDLIEHMEDVCLEGYDKKGYVDFEKVTGKNKIFSKAYFDGGSFYNDARETEGKLQINEDNLKITAGNHIKSIQNNVAKKGAMWWPHDMSNFERCAYRSAMCCWPQDRQAGDNNGNCATPYDDKCRNADPGDNTDVCYHDMSRSSGSTSVDLGISLFPGDNAKGEGALHCHGFAWSQDRMHPSSLFRANNLFYVSMYDHLSQRGYVKAVPGAPMCGCTEQMPVVTRSDCTEIALTNENIKFNLSPSGMSAQVGDANIAFNACKGIKTNNDLLDYYKKLLKQGDTAEYEFRSVSRYLVGKKNCKKHTEQFFQKSVMTSVTEDTGLNGRSALTTLFYPPEGSVTSSIQMELYKPGNCMDAGPVEKVLMWECHGRDHQLFTFIRTQNGYRVRAGHDGQCLGIKGGSVSNGGQLIRSACGNQPQQLWIIEGEGNKRVFKNVKSKKCVYVNLDGKTLVQWTCNHKGGETRSYFQMAPGISSISLGYGRSGSNQGTIASASQQAGAVKPVTIKNMLMKTCLSTTRNVHGGNIVQAPCNESIKQKFYFKAMGGGAYQIVSAGDNKCVAVSYGSKGNLANVVQANCSERPYFLWYVQYSMGNPPFLVAKHSNKCLHGHRNGKVDQDTCVLHATHERWYIGGKIPPAT